MAYSTSLQGWMHQLLSLSDLSALHWCILCMAHDHHRSGGGSGSKGPSVIDKRGQEEQCPHCDRIFKQNSRLKEHILKQHPQQADVPEGPAAAAASAPAAAARPQSAGPSHSSPSHSSAIPGPNLVRRTNRRPAAAEQPAALAGACGACFNQPHDTLLASSG
jgi:hypothetical protein